MDSFGPSSRTPGRSSRFNEADNLERQLKQDSHRTWGFVIFRTTYDGDADWDRFVKLLRAHTEYTLDLCNGADMMGSLGLTVIENREKFEGADAAKVRESFREWASTAPGREQGAGAGMSQRYRYCIQVDLEALGSVLDDEGPVEDSDLEGEHFVRLICGDWAPREGDAGADEFEEDEEPVEGCTQEDVGWMRVEYQSVMVGMYLYLRDENSWHTEYRRPPAIASA